MNLQMARGKSFYGIAAVAIFLAVGIVPAQDSAEETVGEYVIGVEDLLSISVWREPELETAVRVRPDGKVTFPLVGDVQAEGRTPRQLTSDIAEALRTFIKEPVVTVIVDEINSFKVYVLGEVTTQGELLLRRKTRFLEAIALAGGLTNFADKSKIILIRYEDGRDTRLRIDYQQVVKGDGSASNFYLKPGDTIIVN